MTRSRSPPPTAGGDGPPPGRRGRPGGGGGSPAPRGRAPAAGATADGRLRGAVHGRRAHDAPAEIDETPQHLAERAAPGGIADVEGLPRAEPERRDPLAGRGYRAEDRRH